MWDLESYTKLMWRNPLRPNGADWVREYENGTWTHKAEPRHATIAITDESVIRMKEHKDANTGKPLFLYVSYNAAHSPLQYEPEWEEDCMHIPHLWRRQYCAMVVGLDKGITRVVEMAKQHLGKNTVVVISPDNGGSVWFGGNNQPLRSGKLTPFEGGVRVPAIALDLGGGHIPLQKEFHHMVHISDWLPTFLSWTGANELGQSLGLDGVNQAEAFRTDKEARKDVLLELFTAEGSHDHSESAAYRKGKYKVITGDIRDPYWYTEPTDDRVATSDTTLIPKLLESITRGLEWMFGNGRSDNTALFLKNYVLFRLYQGRQQDKVLLFDIEADPTERNNLAAEKPEIVKELLDEIEKYKAAMPPQARYWMVNQNWTEAFVPGDCDGQTVLSQDLCRFSHHWLPDSADLTNEEALGLVNGLTMRVWLDHPAIMASLVIMTALPLILFMMILRSCCGKSEHEEKQKKKQN